MSVAVTACQSRVEEVKPDTAFAHQTADSTATASPGRVARPADSAAVSRPADSITAAASGREPGSIPARPTPTTTSENTIVRMRLHLQRLDTASVENLQRSMKEHASMLGDMLTTMEVEVQALTSPAKNSWLAASDSAENDLDRLALAQGEALRTAFRAHRLRVLRLLDEFRVLVPAKLL